MSNRRINLDNLNDDFGFSEIKPMAESDTPTATAAQKMYDEIKPLIMRLKQDADSKPMINWPNRAESLEKFDQRLQEIVAGKR